MLRTIRLHGDLAERFGSTHRFDIETAREAGSALAVNFPGFADYVRLRSYRVVRGRLRDDDDNSLSMDQLNLRLGRCDEVHIVPVIEGAGGRGGILKIVLGVALVAFGVWGGISFGFGATALSAFGTGVSWGNIALFGASALLKGIVSTLSPQPRSDYRSREVEPRPSFLFNGAVNTVEQGGPVPLVYGRVRIGGHIISASLTAQEY